MFREKYNSFSEKRGYLYIRETIYKRDGRTLKRKPARLGDGSATKERGKYSIKKDTYCGKITEDIFLKYIITFNEFVSNILKTDKKTKYKDFLEYKTKSSFDDIIDDFTLYLIYIYNLDKEDFFTGKKQVYAINNGYFSRDTIEWVRRFKINPKNYYTKEMQRFAFRCHDVGIYDEDIINLLYLKLNPEIDQNILSENENNEDLEVKKLKLKNYRNFIQKSIEYDKE